MSFLDFLGGAAATGQGILQQQMQAETQLQNHMQLADYTSQLEVQKQETLAQLREDRNRKNAKAVTDAADKIGQDRTLSKLNAGPVDPLGTDATQGFLQSDPAQDAGPYSGLQVTGGGDPTGMMPPNMAPAVTMGGPAAAALATDAATPRKTYSAADIAGLTPDQLAKIGVPNTRAQRVDDLATAAESLGQLDMAKDYRGQQQVEAQRAAAEAQARRAEAMENLRWTAEQRKQASDDARWANEAEKRDNDARRAEIAQQRADAMLERIAKMGAADPVSAALKFVDGQRKELANQSAEIRSLMKTEMDNAQRPADKEKVRAAYQAKLDALDQRRSEVEDDFSALRDKVGLPGRAPKPAASPAPSDGAVKAPYPDGTRLTGPDGKTYVVRGGKPVLE